MDGRDTRNLWKTAAVAVVLALSAVLLFGSLGRYALWDDEAAQAMEAEQVWRTGDTSALVGQNIVAYDNGDELKNLHDRANPPLVAYLMAPFVRDASTNALLPRLPLAICGFLTIALMLAWVWKSRADAATWTLLCLGILGNVSLFLFFREARYYGLVIFVSTAIGYLYVRWSGSRKWMLAISLLLFCLLAAHYITYAGVSAALLIDYVLWRRKERPLSAADWGILLAPQAVLGAVVIAIWNPFATAQGADLFANTAFQRLSLFWWNLRDLDRCEFCSGVLLAAAVVLYVWKRGNPLLLRGPVAIAVYCATIALVSPKVISLSAKMADSRYLLPVIPLGIAVGTLVLRKASGQRVWLALLLGGAAFGTNLFNLGFLFPEGLRSSILLYANERMHPVPGSYGAAIDWVKRNVKAGASIWVSPSYASYPLMYHAPQAIYAWQLKYPPKPQFQHLLSIHFFGIEPPDYMIAFGPAVVGTRKVVQSGRKLGFIYEQVATLDQFWDSVHRPGLINHNFAPVTKFDKATEAIYIFKRVKPPVP